MLKQSVAPGRITYMFDSLSDGGVFYLVASAER